MPESKDSIRFESKGSSFTGARLKELSSQSQVFPFFGGNIVPRALSSSSEKLLSWLIYRGSNVEKVARKTGNRANIFQ